MRFAVLLEKQKSLNSEAHVWGCCRITFLPSEFGEGYRASIRGRVGDANNWKDCGCSDLRGIALDPYEDDSSDAIWLRYVRETLARQGVVFVSASPGSS